MATRLGVAIKDARIASGMRQMDAAARAGISQVRFGELERGLGAGASIETWAVAAASVGEQLVGFLERGPGAAQPRDIEHLRRQAALIDIAASGGWRALPEHAVDPSTPRSRSIDVALLRVARREAVVSEIWDWFDDVGAAYRSLDGKRDALISGLRRDYADEAAMWQVRCLFVVRRTRRNERLVRDLRPLFAARFGGSSRAWIRALTDPNEPLPDADGLLWSTKGFALQGSKLHRAG